MRVAPSRTVAVQFGEGCTCLAIPERDRRYYDPIGAMLSRVPVSLSEVLEVRGTGLTEHELWALLVSGTRPLQALVDNCKLKIAIHVCFLNTSGIRLDTCIRKN